MKYLPPEMKDWYFTFNWNVKDIWNLEGKIESRFVKDLRWHLKVPFWSSQRGQGMLFDLRPVDVLNNPGAHAYHANRISEANENYPISLVEYKGREIIIDGIHRLAKLARNNEKEIEVKIICRESIGDIAKR